MANNCLVLDINLLHLQLDQVCDRVLHNEHVTALTSRSSTSSTLSLRLGFVPELLLKVSNIALGPLVVRLCKGYSYTIQFKELLTRN